VMKSNWLDGIPLPTADITLEMSGDEIELEPFEIVALPSLSAYQNWTCQN